MQAGERYFMASVDLHSAKQRIERILEWAEDGSPPSMDLMAACVSDITAAMVKVSQNRLSDPRYRPPNPGCEAGCGQEGAYRVCHTHSVDVPYRDKP